MSNNQAEIDRLNELINRYNQALSNENIKGADREQLITRRDSAINTLNTLRQSSRPAPPSSEPSPTPSRPASPITPIRPAPPSTPASVPEGYTKVEISDNLFTGQTRMVETSERERVDTTIYSKPGVALAQPLVETRVMGVSDKFLSPAPGARVDSELTYLEGSEVTRTELPGRRRVEKIEPVSADNFGGLDPDFVKLRDYGKGLMFSLRTVPARAGLFAESLGFGLPSQPGFTPGVSYDESGRAVNGDGFFSQQVSKARSEVEYDYYKDGFVPELVGGIVTAPLTSAVIMPPGFTSFIGKPYVSSVESTTRVGKAKPGETEFDTKVVGKSVVKVSYAKPEVEGTFKTDTFTVKQELIGYQKLSKGVIKVDSAGWTQTTPETMIGSKAIITKSPIEGFYKVESVGKMGETLKIKGLPKGPLTTVSSKAVVQQLTTDAKPIFAFKGLAQTGVGTPTASAGVPSTGMLKVFTKAQPPIMTPSITITAKDVKFIQPPRITTKPLTAQQAAQISFQAQATEIGIGIKEASSLKTVFTASRPETLTGLTGIKLMPLTTTTIEEKNIQGITMPPTTTLSTVSVTQTMPGITKLPEAETIVKTKPPKPDTKIMPSTITGFQPISDTKIDTIVKPITKPLSITTLKTPPIIPPTAFSGFSSFRLPPIGNLKPETPGGSLGGRTRLIKVKKIRTEYSPDLASIVIGRTAKKKPTKEVFSGFEARPIIGKKVKVFKIKKVVNNTTVKRVKFKWMN